MGGNIPLPYIMICAAAQQARPLVIMARFDLRFRWRVPD